MRAVSLIGVALAVLTGCSSAPSFGPVATEAEARAFLDRAVELAMAGDFAGLCAIGGGNCEHFLEDAGRDVPAQPPTSVGIRHPDQTERSAGGVVLELCGTHDSGEPYYSEMLVFRDLVRTGGLGGLHAIEPIYWSGMLIADDLTVGGEGVDAAERCR